MRKIATLLPLLLVCGWAVEHTLVPVGYMRLQTSLQEKKETTCFMAPGAGSKYRLGNECETWIEFGASDTLRFDNGVTWHTQLRPTYMSPNDEKIEFLQWDEAFTEVSGLFDAGGSLWIGRRFYQRYDSHISDYWPLNMSGQGFGVERLGLGNDYFLSYSFMYKDLGPTTVPTRSKSLNQSHDLRLHKTHGRGEALLFLNYSHIASENFAPGARIADQEGYAVGVLLKDTRLTEEWFGMKGENIAIVEYGTGSSRRAGNGAFESDATIDLLLNGRSLGDASTFRIVNYNAFEKGSVGIMSSLTYEQRDAEAFENVKQEWYSVGVRPYWFFHRNLRAVLETGYDVVEDRIAGAHYSLLKTTVALEAAFERGVWARPAVRLYYTAADWSQSAQGLVGGSYYSDATSGDNVGVQLEYWW